MKRLVAFILVLLLAIPAPAATVYFDLADFQHTYLTARRLVITPQTMPSVSGTNIVSMDPRSQVTSTSGRVTFTNVAAGTYRCEFFGPSVVTPFYITLTNTSATINAKDIVSVSTNSPAGASAYSIASMDALLANLVEWGTLARNYLYVATNGNDATAVKGRPDRPWLTLTAAKTNAVAGDTIGVYAGEYLGTNLLKNMVGWWFNPGARTTNLGVLCSPFEGSMFHDYSGAITSIVAGAGVFVMNYETNIAAINQSSIVGLSNAATRLNFAAKEIDLRHFYINDFSGAAFQIANCNRLNATVETIFDLDLDRHSFDPGDPEVEKFSQAVAINWINGDCYFHVTQTYLENGRVIAASGSTNNLYYTGDSAKTYTDFFTMDSTSPEQKVWLDVKDIFAQYAAIRINAGAKGKLYVLEPMKIGAQGGGFGNGAVVINGNPQTWIKIQKLTSFASPDPDYFDISGGINFISVQHYEHDILNTGVTTVGPAINITGGTNVIEGGYLPATNVVGIKLSGAHRTTLKNMTIQTFDSNPSGTGDTNWPVMNTTNGLVFQNTSLKAPNANVKSYWNSNAINVASVEGILFLSTTTNLPARFTNGIVASGGVTKFFP